MHHLGSASNPFGPGLFFFADLTPYDLRPQGLFNLNPPDGYLFLTLCLHSLPSRSIRRLGQTLPAAGL